MNGPLEDPAGDIGARSAPSASIEILERVSAAVAAHDKANAVRLAVEAVTNGSIGIAGLYRDVLTPLLAQAGARWQRGTVAVWEEHLASATVRTIVEILYPGVLKAKAALPPAGRSVLLACPPEEAHDLGLRMVADRFDMAGWTTYYLGPDTPVEEIADAARRLGVDAIVMSSSTHFHRLAVRHAVDSLRSALPGVDVWVGGPAFVGDVAGWSPREVLDIDALLGPPPVAPGRVAPAAPPVQAREEVRPAGSQGPGAGAGTPPSSPLDGPAHAPAVSGETGGAAAPDAGAAVGAPDADAPDADAGAPSPLRSDEDRGEPDAARGGGAPVAGGHDDPQDGPGPEDRGAPARGRGE